VAESKATEPERDGRRVRGDRTRRAILDQAVRIASIEGLEGLTFGKVALAADLPKSTIQVLFGSRETLQAETLNFGVELFADGMREPLSRARTPYSRLRVLAEAWFDIVERKEPPGGCLLTAAANEFRARDGALRDLVQSHRERWRKALITAAEAAREAGELRKDAEPRLLAFEIMAMQHAANVAAELDGPKDFDMARKAVGRLISAARRKT
jgi:AcrR family transcriptional regulator